MTGIEILASQEVAVEFAFNGLTYWITVGIAACVGLLIGFVCIVRDDAHWLVLPFMLTGCMIGGVIIGGLLGNATERPVEYETQYKVAISDEVSMTDFLEKYEIVATEGKIYTVREVKEVTK